MKFGLLNIEDPEAQGYAAGTYDLVVAAWVLHAAPTLEVTIRNVRKTLKSAENLILLELTRPDILQNGFAFGTLLGWWVGTEDNRE